MNLNELLTIFRSCAYTGFNGGMQGCVVLCNPDLFQVVLYCVILICYRCYLSLSPHPAYVMLVLRVKKYGADF